MKISIQLDASSTVRGVNRGLTLPAHPNAIDGTERVDGPWDGKVYVPGLDQFYDPLTHRYQNGAIGPLPSQPMTADERDRKDAEAITRRNHTDLASDETQKTRMLQLILKGMLNGGNL